MGLKSPREINIVTQIPQTVSERTCQEAPHLRPESDWDVLCAPHSSNVEVLSKIAGDVSFFENISREGGLLLGWVSYYIVG